VYRRGKDGRIADAPNKPEGPEKSGEVVQKVIGIVDGGGRDLRASRGRGEGEVKEEREEEGW
jgi:hypothetical protein